MRHHSFDDIRTTVTELILLREILMHKFGREFSLAVMANRDGCVTERVRTFFEIQPHVVSVFEPLLTGDE